VIDFILAFWGVSARDFQLLILKFPVRAKAGDLLPDHQALIDQP
jgi:hypothetical protein